MASPAAAVLCRASALIVSQPRPLVVSYRSYLAARVGPTPGRLLMPRAHVASGQAPPRRSGCGTPRLRTYSGSSSSLTHRLFLPPPLPWTWKCKSVFFSIFYVSRSVGLLIEVNVLRTTTGANICRALNSYNVDAIALEKILLIR
jgi:hypothetical protein